jgi:hypothetical protein
MCGGGKGDVQHRTNSRMTADATKGGVGGSQGGQTHSQWQGAYRGIPEGVSGARGVWGKMGLRPTALSSEGYKTPPFRGEKGLIAARGLEGPAGALEVFDGWACVVPLRFVQ